jgi:CheY-like chemotaxis protein
VESSAVNEVLVVDDDEGFREALSALLALKGFTVELATNGREALEWLRGAGRPRAVLVDLMMPVMSGWELLSVMRQDPSLATIPIAVISAARDPGPFDGPTTVLPKPCDIHQILQFLAQAR